MKTVPFGLSATPATSSHSPRRKPFARSLALVLFAGLLALTGCTLFLGKGKPEKASV